MDTDELEAARAAAIAEDRCFSKDRLRDEFRMKPRDGAEPVAFYKNGCGGQFGVYKIADCVPMQAKSNKPPSEKQKRARAVLAIKVELRSNQVEASSRALGWLEESPLFLDTETTGLDYNAQILELAICDAQGAILFETRLRPTVPIEPGAQEVHGISEQELDSALTWPEVSSRVREILSGRSLVIFNAAYDIRLLRQTAAAFGESTDWIDALKTHCAMYLAADTFGATNRHGSISLATAVDAAGVEWRGSAHSAIADTLTTVDLVQAIASIRANLDQELTELTAKL